MAASAFAGGVGAELTGGKFSDGAVTAAFGYLFNQVLSGGEIKAFGVSFGQAKGIASIQAMRKVEKDYYSSPEFRDEVQLAASNVSGDISVALGGVNALCLSTMVACNPLILSVTNVGSVGFGVLSYILSPMRTNTTGFMLAKDIAIYSASLVRPGAAFDSISMHNSIGNYVIDLGQ